MLLTIVDTKSYGKFVLHLYPYQPLNLPKDDVTPLQLTQCLTHAFQYFGIYQKSDVISTSTGNLKEGTVVDLLEANEKYTQIVMGLDQNCVLVSKSSFLDSSRQYFQNIQYSNQNIQLGEFISINDSQSSIVNSISLVYRQQTFDNVEQVKHKLAFLVSALQIRQKHSRYLSKQISTIVEQKNQFNRCLKDKCALYLKENNTIYEEFKIKMIFKQIQAQAAAVIKKIHIFQLLEKIFTCWDKKQFFKPENLQDQFLANINGINLRVPTAYESKEMIKAIQNKTIITIPPKLNSLPSIFYPHQRIQYIYERLLSNNTKPLKSILSNQLQISSQSVYHTVYFLMRNDLSVCVFPFDTKKYFSYYTLRSMPDKKVIQKFNSLFQNQNEDILDYLKKFERYFRVQLLDQKIKYLLLNKIIKEVQVYIQKLQPVNSHQSSKLLDTSIHDLKSLRLEPKQITSTIFLTKHKVEQTLNQYVTKPQQINKVLSRCRQKGINKAQVFQFVKHNSTYWKFIFVQRDQ